MTGLILASGWTKPHWVWAEFAYKARRRGYAVYRPEYPHWGLGGIADGVATQTLKTVERAAQEQDYVVFIGHSMGGLVGRYIRAYHDAPFDAYISVATPHNGTFLAKLGFFSLSARDMAPGSPFLVDLAVKEGTNGVPSLSIAAEYDLVVADAEFAGANQHIEAPNTTHTSVIMDPDVHNTIFHWIQLTKGLRWERSTHSA